MAALGKLGDMTSSDVVVRLRTDDDRENLFYTHSAIIGPKCSYFATCLLPEDKPLLNSKICIELFCSENEFNYHVMLLRLLYAVPNESLTEIWHNVANALGILKLASRLGCDEIAKSCVQYLESVPWEESEEEEILKTLPAFGPIVLPVLARLQPVNPQAAHQVFISALEAATMGTDTSSPGITVNIKTSAQEQVEYMLTEDDDAPLITADDHIRSLFRSYFEEMFKEFLATLIVNAAEEPNEAVLLGKVSDLVWASRVLPKMELLPEMVFAWSEASSHIMCFLQHPSSGSRYWSTKLKLVEITSKVLEAVGYGNVVMHCQERTRLVKLWLPFTREVKAHLEALEGTGEAAEGFDGELWHNIECAMTSLVLALPSEEQAEILAGWLKQQDNRFPDLSEAFEVWCFRSKAAKRRLNEVDAISSA